MSGKYFKSFPFPLVPGEKRCPLALCFRIKWPTCLLRL
jgi:hypothetical protein